MDIYWRVHPLPASSAELIRKWSGGPADRRRRIIDAFARCCILVTDRPVPDFEKVWPYQDILPFLDAVADPDSHWWPEAFRSRIPPPSAIGQAGRKAALERIAKGGLGIEDRLGVWNGSFWSGLRISGAIRKGPGTEFSVWEKAHQELMDDMSEMPLTHRLEPRVSRSGLRRLRRCYAAFLPPNDPLGRSALAGLFAGATLATFDGEEWLVLPDDESVRAVLAEWEIPVASRLALGKHRLLVSPFFGALFASGMPRHSALRALAVRKPAGCPFLSVVYWERMMSRKGQRYMPFPDALPWGASKATFFRRGWHRRDLHFTSAVKMGIKISPRLRDVAVEWYQRRTCERNGHMYDPETFPLSPDIGIPPLSFPPSIAWH